MPDAYERTLPEVFPDFAPGNFTWDDELQGWVWTTFNEWQWDVNWTNPDVLVEYAEIVLYLANLGVEVLRLDAIAFTWKRLGTNCQNQPEVHAVDPGAAHRGADRLPGARLQGGGHRRPARSRAVPRPGSARRPGQRPRLPQQPHGAGLVDARDGQHRPDQTSPHGAAADAAERHVDLLRPVPRRHRVGHRRRRCRRRGARRPCAPPLPVELVCRGRARLVGARARLPAQPRHRRQADQRHGGCSDGPLGRGAARRRGRGGARPRAPLPRARRRRRLGRHPGRLER